MNCNLEPYEGNEQYIFFSYCHADAPLAYPIVERLGIEGFRVWYDDGLHPGDDWPELIARHLSKAKVCVAIISRAAAESHNCRNELSFAVANNKPLLSIIAEDFPMPLGMQLQLSSSNFIRQYQYQPEVFYQKLLAAPVLSGCRIPGAFANPYDLREWRARAQAFAELAGEIKKEPSPIITISSVPDPIKQPPTPPPPVSEEEWKQRAQEKASALIKQENDALEACAKQLAEEELQQLQEQRSRGHERNAEEIIEEVLLAGETPAEGNTPAEQELFRQSYRKAIRELAAQTLKAFDRPAGDAEETLTQTIMSELLRGEKTRLESEFERLQISCYDKLRAGQEPDAAAGPEEIRQRLREKKRSGREERRQAEEKALERERREMKALLQKEQPRLEEDARTAAREIIKREIEQKAREEEKKKAEEARKKAKEEEEKRAREEAERKAREEAERKAAQERLAREAEMRRRAEETASRRIEQEFRVLQDELKRLAEEEERRILSLRSEERKECIEQLVREALRLDEDRARDPERERSPENQAYRQSYQKALERGIRETLKAVDGSAEGSTKGIAKEIFEALMAGEKTRLKADFERISREFFEKLKAGEPLDTELDEEHVRQGIREKLLAGREAREKAEKEELERERQEMRRVLQEEIGRLKEQARRKADADRPKPEKPVIGPVQEAEDRAIFIRMQTGEIFKVHEDAVTVGRRQDCSIVLSGNLAISRAALEITRSDDAWTLKNISSSSAVEVNGLLLQTNESTVLNDCAEITIADEQCFMVSGAAYRRIHEEKTLRMLRCKETGETRLFVQDVFPLNRYNKWKRNILGDKRISREQHAEMFRKGQKAMLRDVGSLHGTFLNNRRLKPGEEAELRNGDTIAIVETAFAYYESSIL